MKLLCMQELKLHVAEVALCADSLKIISCFRTWKEEAEALGRFQVRDWAEEYYGLC